MSATTNPEIAAAEAELETCSKLLRECDIKMKAAQAECDALVEEAEANPDPHKFYRDIQAYLSTQGQVYRDQRNAAQQSFRKLEKAFGKPKGYLSKADI